MRGQPPRKAVGLAIREQIDHLVALKVAQDGPVALVASPGPIIDAQDARGQLRPIITGTGHPKQRIAAQRHRQSGRQERTGSTAERQTDMALIHTFVWAADGAVGSRSQSSAQRY